jgi:hypothetical protein
LLFDLPCRQWVLSRRQAHWKVWVEQVLFGHVLGMCTIGKTSTFHLKGEK